MGPGFLRRTPLDKHRFEIHTPPKQSGPFLDFACLASYEATGSLTCLIGSNHGVSSLPLHRDRVEWMPGLRSAPLGRTYVELGPIETTRNDLLIAVLREGLKEDWPGGRVDEGEDCTSGKQ